MVKLVIVLTISMFAASISRTSIAQEIKILASIPSAYAQYKSDLAWGVEHGIMKSYQNSKIKVSVKIINSAIDSQSQIEQISREQSGYDAILVHPIIDRDAAAIILAAQQKGRLVIVIDSAEESPAGVFQIRIDYAKLGVEQGALAVDHAEGTGKIISMGYLAARDLREAQRLTSIREIVEKSSLGFQELLITDIPEALARVRHEAQTNSMRPLVVVAPTATMALALQSSLLGQVDGLKIISGDARPNAKRELNNGNLLALTQPMWSSQTSVAVQMIAEKHANRNYVIPNDFIINPIRFTKPDLEKTGSGGYWIEKDGTVSVCNTAASRPD